MENIQLKSLVSQYWNKASCGTIHTNKEKYGPEYFQEIEETRYRIEPEIHSFAQFSRFRNKKILEIGVGAGTDFIQWVRSGAKAYGIDLTAEAIKNTKRRLEIEGLHPNELRVSDGENLPYEDAFFDLVYSWGVIHHSPDMMKCLKEMIRVTKPGGQIKFMIYNRHSLFTFYRYLQFGLLKGSPFKSWKKIMWDHQESPGTKAYTIAEVQRMMAQYPVSVVQNRASLTKYDLLYSHQSKLVRFFAKILAYFVPLDRMGWFLTVELKKNA